MFVFGSTSIIASNSYNERISWSLVTRYNWVILYGIYFASPPVLSFTSDKYLQSSGENISTLRSEIVSKSGGF